MSDETETQAAPEAPAVPTPAPEPAPPMGEAVQTSDAVGAEVIRGGVPVAEPPSEPEQPPPSDQEQALAEMARQAQELNLPDYLPPPAPIRSNLPMGIVYSQPEPEPEPEPLPTGDPLDDLEVLIRAGSRVSRAEWRNRDRWVTINRVGGRIVLAVSVVGSVKWGFPTAEDLAAADWIVVG